MSAEIRDYLRINKGALGLALVGGAADFQAAAETKPTATPAAYVVLLDEIRQENQWEGSIIQPVRQVTGVILVVRNVADPRGEAAQADIETLRGAVKGLLFGWSPNAGKQPLQMSGGRLLAFSDGLMWWQDTYFTDFFDRSTL